MENKITEQVLILTLQTVASLVFTGFAFMMTQSALRDRLISGVVAAISGFILVYIIFMAEVSLVEVFVIGAVVSIIVFALIYVVLSRVTGSRRLNGGGNNNMGILRNVMMFFSGISLLIGVFFLLGNEILMGVVLWLISLVFIASITILNGGES